MGYAKKTILSWTGLLLLIMFLSYGLDIVLTLNGYGGVATYLRAENYTTSYGFTFVKYTWDYISYTNNLKTTEVIRQIANHVDPAHLERGFLKAFSYAVPADNIWEQLLYILKYMANLWISLLNVIIYFLNVPLLVAHNSINALIYYILSLLGINMTYGSWWLANTISWQINNFWVPFIEPI